MTKFSNEITWAFRFYADLESDQPTQRFTLLNPTDDEDEAYTAARSLVPVHSDIHVNVDMGDTGH